MESLENPITSSGNRSAGVVFRTFGVIRHLPVAAARSLQRQQLQLVLQVELIRLHGFFGFRLSLRVCLGFVLFVFFSGAGGCTVEDTLRCGSEDESLSPYH